MIYVHHRIVAYLFLVLSWWVMDQRVWGQHQKDVSPLARHANHRGEDDMLGALMILVSQPWYNDRYGRDCWFNRQDLYIVLYSDSLSLTICG